MNIAVFLPSWVGDAVMATPALRALRSHYAEARMIGVMKPYVADVFGGGD
jgi:heptosyltransferase II